MMPRITVKTDENRYMFPFAKGNSVREILEAAGLHIRSGCRGDGACGFCLVKIEAGNANRPTENECLILSAGQLDQNIRLACQMMPATDLCIRIIGKSLQSNWRDLSPDHLPCTPGQLFAAGGRSSAETTYGLAVDLGTTHISLSLWDLKHGDRLSSRVTANPQSSFGMDVMTRLIAAGESQTKARKIGRMPLKAIYEELRFMSTRQGFLPHAVTRITIVGNSPMLALLTGADARQLLQPQFWDRPVECGPDNPQAWVSVFGINPHATVEIIPPFAGFVGSDLLVGVLTTRLTDLPGSLFIDFGTNSEIALWDGRTLWVTSAAGGPAFEGCGIQCGMPAETGAIYSVCRRPDSPEPRFDVIGGGKAKGLCGSGMVDLIAFLRGTGKLMHTGRFAMPNFQEGFVLSSENPALRLTHRDVDILQRAKAAIGVGINTLLERAQMHPTELGRVCVCGIFGQYLNIGSAQLIGLLPDIPTECIELCGNTALAGCERMLLSPALAKDMASLRRHAKIINLSQASNFEMLFLENLYLDPLKANEA